MSSPFESDGDGRAKSLRPEIPGPVVPSTCESFYPELQQRLGELRESQERYQAVFNATDDAIFIHDAGTGAILDANLRAVEMFGRARDELLCHSVEIISEGRAPYSGAEAKVQIRKAVESGPILFEWRCRRNDGSLFWTEVALRPFDLADGKAVVAVVRDITHRKAAERELRDSRDFITQILNTVPQSVFWKDCHGRYLGCNASFARDIGLSAPAEIVGKTDYDLPWPEEETAAYLADDQEVMSTGRPKLHITEPLQQADGTRLWIDTTKVPLLDDTDEVIGVLGVYEDITERKRTAEELRESRHMLRLVLDAIPVRVFWKDTSLTYMGGNRMFAQDAGLSSPEELVGGTDYDYQWQDEAELYRRDDREVMDSGRAKLNYEEPQTAPDGQKIWLRTSKIPLRDDAGESIGVLGVYEDITERKQAEEALRESEERFRALVELSPMSILLLRDGKYIYANPTSARLMGYDDPEEIVGVDVLGTIAPEFRAGAVERLQRAADGGENTPIEVRILRPDGKELWSISTSVSVMMDGRPTVIVVGQDITERKHAEEALREADRRLREMVDNSPFGTHSYELLPDGRLVLVSVNRACSEILGVDCGPLVGRTIEEAFPALTDTDIPDAYRRVAAAGEPYYHESVDYDERGIRGSYEVHAFQTAPNRMSVMFRDITERRQAEEALRRSEADLRRAQEFAHVGSYSWDIRANRMTWSDELRAILGQPDAEASYELAVDRMHPDDRPRMEALARESLANGKPFAAEYRIVRPNGEIRHVHDVAAIELDRDGRPTMMFGTLQDITDRKMAEAERESLENQLRQAQKMEAVGRLAGGVAHDFNNKLQAILGFGGMLLSDDGLSEHLKDATREILQAAEQSAALTKQLLAFARKQTVAPQVLDLNETVSGMTTMLKRLIGEDIDLLWKPAEDLWPVRVDPSQVDQVLANLCVNARDAIDGVGKITIETANICVDDVESGEFADRTPGEYVMLAVGDSGCGMDAETVAQIFEPFFTTKAPGEGTGLGLAMVYGVCRQNGGFVTVYSEPGEGTIFKVYLPRHEKAQPKKAGPISQPSVSKGHETVLFVEDEPAILKFGKIMLESLGYQVLAANTPGEALRLAREHSGPVDLLVTDVVMPEMNGRELARQVLTLHPDVKRLFMSGYTANVIAHHGVLDEGVQFLQKPFSKAKLAARVREVLDGD